MVARRTAWRPHVGSVHRALDGLPGTRASRGGPCRSSGPRPGARLTGWMVFGRTLPRRSSAFRPLSGRPSDSDAPGASDGLALALRIALWSTLPARDRSRRTPSISRSCSSRPSSASSLSRPSSWPRDAGARAGGNPHRRSHEELEEQVRQENRFAGRRRPGPAAQSIRPRRRAEGRPPGSWEWDILANEVSWSDELFRIYGLEPGSVDMTYQAWSASIPRTGRSGGQHPSGPRR